VVKYHLAFKAFLFAGFIDLNLFDIAYELTLPNLRFVGEQKDAMFESLIVFL